MLLPILQALAQQIGPTVQPLLQTVLPVAQKVPPRIYILAARSLSKEVTNWYRSLDFETQKKIDQAIVWVVKDLSGDFANTMTGLPVSQIVKPLVGKVLDIAQTDDNSPEAKAYIEARLIQELNQGIEKSESGIETFKSYEDYLIWFEYSRPAKQPSSKEQFYHSLRYMA